MASGVRSIQSRVEAASRGPHRQQKSHAKVSRGPTKTSIRKLSKVNLQQELRSRQAPTDGKKDVLIARLLQLRTQESEFELEAGNVAPLQASGLTGLLADLGVADEQFAALRESLTAVEAKKNMQRSHIQELSAQLLELQNLSGKQSAQAQATALKAAQQSEDVAWVKQMTAEIQALSSRITSLLRELLERDGVVAALRLQLRQRQQALEMEAAAAPALVAAGMADVEQELGGRGQGEAAAATGFGDDPAATAPQPRLADQVAELDALYAASPASERAAIAVPQLVTRQTTGAALSQAGSHLRSFQSPGVLLAAAALQGDRIMGSIMSMEDCSRFYTASAGILGAAVLAAACLS
ncbi:hypothetical protein WJX84_011656 [Apatococcus fuscideae]|uniref:SAP domain-containing protein n=1 Tax=Apatococcus fuscideae TaxID=2026836 RepID=A0AAW1SV67_9CHLO